MKQKTMDSKHIIINDMLEHDKYEEIPIEARAYARARYVPLKSMPIWKKIVILITIVPLGVVMLPFILFFGWRASRND